MRSVMWSRRASILGVASLALPFAAAVGLALSRPWSSSTDLALMELRTLDVGGPATPLVGPYSRFGWYHPGPLAFWILALPYRLAGGRPVGLLVGAAAVHAVAAGTCLVLAHRRGGRALTALTALGLAALIGGFGARALVNFWNPYLPLLALVFLVLATWSIVEGDTGLLPAVVGVSCFAWQSHLSYLPLTGALVVVASGAAVVRGRREVGRVLGATVVTAAVCLAPIALEERTHEPGNLGLVVASLQHPPGPVLGAGRAAAILADQLSPAGPWLTGDDGDRDDTSEGVRAGERHPLVLLVPLAALAGVTVLAARAGAGAAVRLLVLAGVCAGTSLLAAARTVGEPFTYLLAWLRPVAMVMWLAVAWGVVCAARAASWGRSRPRLAAGTAVAVAGFTATAAAGSILAHPRALPEEGASAPLQILGPAAVQATAGQPRVRLAMSGGWCAGELGTGIGVLLAGHGTDVVVPETSALPFGRQRGGGATAPAVELVCGPGTAEHIARSPVAPLATAGLLPAAELAELRRLQDEVRAELVAQGRADLLDVVENQAFLTVADLPAAGVALDRHRVERVSELMARSRYMSAVYYRPAG